MSNNPLRNTLNTSAPTQAVAPLVGDPPQLGIPSMLVYVLIGTLGAIIWDILSNINTDYHILRNFPIRVPMVVYFLSRITTLVCFMFFTIINTRARSVTECLRLLTISAWIGSVSISSTALLFFLRVRAIYQNRKYVIAFFFLSWLSVVAGCVMKTTNGGKKISIFSSDEYCADDPDINLTSLVTAMAIIPMINGTLSFFAVSWRLMQNTHIKLTLGNGIKVILFGYYLPAFSKALLQDGQVYFLTTVTLSILSTVSFYSSTIPRAYSIPLVYPNIAVMNLMGCRLYRNTKLGIRRLSDPSDSEPSQSNMGFQIQETQNNSHSNA